MTDNHPSNQNLSPEALDLAKALHSAIDRAHQSGYAEGHEAGYIEGLQVGQGQITETPPLLFVQHQAETTS